MTAVLRVSRLAAPITVLGPGARVALWVQGCTIGCVGCASVDTWDAEGGASWSVDELAGEIVDAAGAAGATGLTVTGGEPFQQPDAVAELIRLVRRRWRTVAPDVLVFTGYAAAAARRRSPALWDAADIVVAGPYRRDRPSDHPLLGSANQTVEVVTELGAERMSDVPSIGRPRLQVSAADGALALTGLPDPGDLDRLRAALAARGITLGGVSWDGRDTA